MDAIQPLNGRVDEGHAAKRIGRQAAKILLCITVDDDDFQISVQQLKGCSDSCKSSAHNGNIKLLFLPCQLFPRRSELVIMYGL